MLRLRQLRKEKGITQADLGKIYGLGDVAINYYERGKRQMNYKMLFALSDYFGVSIDYLLGHKPPRETTTLTKEEAGLVDMYRNLTHDQQQYILGVTKGMSLQ